MQSTSSQRTLRVLYVDEVEELHSEKILQSAVADFLVPILFSVASNYLSGLELAGTIAFDVVILHTALTPSNPMEFVRTLWKRNAPPPKIILMPPEPWILSAELRNADGVVNILRTPFSFHAFRQVLFQSLPSTPSLSTPSNTAQLISTMTPNQLPTIGVNVSNLQPNEETCSHDDRLGQEQLSLDRKATALSVPNGLQRGTSHDFPVLSAVSHHHAIHEAAANVEDCSSAGVGQLGALDSHRSNTSNADSHLHDVHDHDIVKEIRACRIEDQHAQVTVTTPWDASMFFPNDASQEYHT